MLSNSTNSVRHIARLTTRSGCAHAHRCRCQARPGLVFPHWPSVTSLNQKSQLHAGTRSQFLRRHVRDQASAEKLRRGRPNDAQGDEDDEYDEWNAITALESSRRQLDWRQHLQTKQQLDDESDFWANRAKDQSSWITTKRILSCGKSSLYIAFATATPMPMKLTLCGSG